MADPHALFDRHAARAIELRHELHQCPELGYDEHATAAIIRRQLDALGLPHVDDTPSVPTATVAVIGDRSKLCVALRADIDALPITETADRPYKSRTPGRMHACGHDGHIATLLGAAAVLRNIEDLPVCVKLIFQPAEEGGGGGERLVQAGVLEKGDLGPAVKAIFGLHGWPGLPVGTVSTRPGPLLAATDTFEVVFTGAGGHAAFPHFGRDPIAAAASAVVSLQQIASREFDPTEPVVVSVTQFNAGTARNVIPDAATIAGTARTLSDPARVQVREAIKRRCEKVAAAGGCRAEFRWKPGYPPTVNDPAMAEYVAATARRCLGPDRFLPAARPSMGGEDFAYYLEKVPGCFFLVGVQPPGRPDYPHLHTAGYDFTDAAVAVGMKMFVELALGYINVRDRNGFGLGQDAI